MLFQHSKVSIARLTEHVLSIAERSQLELGLPYSFIKKKKEKSTQISSSKRRIDLSKSEQRL